MNGVCECGVLRGVSVVCECGALSQSRIFFFSRTVQL